MATNLRGGAGGDGGGEGDGIASRGAVAARKRRERSMVRSGQVRSRGCCACLQLEREGREGRGCLRRFLLG